MVKIRLFQTGAKHKRTYRIVAIDSHQKRNGKVLEVLGFYDPKTDPATIKINHQKLEKWLKVGAQPTEVVRNLIENEKAA
jgi:small subunit ribosomal protein S16